MWRHHWPGLRGWCQSIKLTCRAQCTDLGKREYSIDLPVTQIMIGDALGLSNEHVCRVLGKLANDGVIEINNHTLKVLDQAALAREAGADPRDFRFRDSLLPIAA